MSKTQLVTIPKYLGRGVFQNSIIKMTDFLYDFIKNNGPITRTEIKEQTGIPRTTIYDSIVKLIIQKRIKKYVVMNKKRGRPKVYYKAII